MDEAKACPGPGGPGTVRGARRRLGMLALSLLAGSSLLAGCSSGGGGSGPPPATAHTISGTVTGASSVTVEIDGLLRTSTTTDASGRYTFGNLRDGTYTVTPILIAYQVSPARRAVVVSGADATGQDFTAVPVPVYAVSGTVAGAASADVELAASIWTARATTELDGSFVFTGVPSGTYAVSASAPGHAVSPARRAVTVAGADADVGSFAAVALATYDPLAAGTLDGARWLTPEYVRTISGGTALLSVRADGMQSNRTQGVTYTSALTVAGAAGRVTSFQADVSVPAASASRSGAAVVYGGLRLYYQPAARRDLAFPGALQDELIAAVELYDAGGGLRVRRRFAHCEDAACATLDASGVSTSDPAGFTESGVDAHAPAAHDTTYTLALSLDEASGVFTWTVQGGAFGSPGVSGTADVSGWAATAGLTLDSTANGFLAARLHARTSDASAAGGGSGAVTATFDNVMVGTNGASATLYDDFSGTGSTEATGFDATRWAAGANGSVEVSVAGLDLRAQAPAGGLAQAVLQAMPPAAFDAWQADLAVVADGPGLNSAVLGGAFLNDGTAGAAHDGTGDVVCEITLSGSAGVASAVRVARCLGPTCTSQETIADAVLFPTAAHPLGPGTVHTVFQQWDAASKTFVARLDDGAPVFLSLGTTAVSPPRVPSRYVRADASLPIGAGGGGAGSTTTLTEVVVRGVRAAP